MNCLNNGFNNGQSLVYLDKIFYRNTEKASPIMTALTTTAETFSQQLTIGSNNYSCGQQSDMNNPCNCNYNCNCCCDVVIGPGTTFVADNAFVIVHSYNLTAPATLTATDVTVDGLPITAITASGGQYIGDISAIIPEITRCQCKSPCSSQCPGNFVMITAAGPWSLLATIVVEGTLTSGGATCPFRLCFSPLEGEPVAVTGASTFAFCGAEIPCQKDNITPSLLLGFDACASFLNPVITVTGTIEAPVITLTGSLVITPQLELKTIRPTLFNLSAYEVDTPCDDVGQCNPCNAHEAECFDIRDNCCCDEKPEPSSSHSSFASGACQCCETNGYGFF
ncbi:MAG: hypothetical protein IJP00_02315 [Firmicutes bacterium]|nr:hypothetical protein [Bacillota bacterium]